MNKVAFITGATRGIGRQIAITLAKEGFDIAINYRKENEDLIETQKMVEDQMVKCFTVQGDVSSFEDSERMVKDIIEEFNHIDILVNNAGITKDMLLMRMSEEQFDSVINTNLKGSFNMIRHASSVMLKQRSGAIINMSSVSGVAGNIGQANYAASKAGVIGLTKATAKELAQRGVTCNAIAPGFIETDMTAVLADETKDAILNSIPLSRAGKPEDVANAAVFLAKNNYITGQVLNVDGGMIM